MEIDGWVIFERDKSYFHYVKSASTIFSNGMQGPLQKEISNLFIPQKVTVNNVAQDRASSCIIK